MVEVHEEDDHHALFYFDAGVEAVVAEGFERAVVVAPAGLGLEVGVVAAEVVVAVVRPLGGLEAGEGFAVHGADFLAGGEKFDGVGGLRGVLEEEVFFLWGEGDAEAAFL